MFTNNPFAGISATISPDVMQAYVLLMVLLVVLGTIYDVLHKKSARYFRENLKRSRSSGTPVGAGEILSIAAKTAVVDVAASGEFCNPQRRIAHLLGMYGFIFFAVASALLIFRYPTAAEAAPDSLALLWHVGAAMVCVGGYWFWFFIRVDVAAEGSSPFRIVQADLFVLTLLGSATFGLVWSWLQAAGSGWSMAAFIVFVLFTTALFVTVPWSKFAHMFFKPAAAFEKRLSEANGTRSNLPPPADKPATFGTAKQHPRHY